MNAPLAILLGLVVALPASAANYDVYLLAGQSNMDGRGKVADLSPEQRRPFANVVIYYRNPPIATDGFKPLAPGYSIAPNDKVKTLPSPTFGPEIGFAKAMTKALPDRQFALIKGSKGGTSLSRDWKPGAGPCYRNFIQTVALARRALASDGSTPTLRGVLWLQGESDSKATAKEYQQMLTAFIARLRADVHQPNLPFLVGEVADNGKRDAVRQAQRAVAQTVLHVGFVPADGLQTSDRGTHFDAASQLTLGERFAAAMLKLLKD